ncbi:MAG: DUF2173 family protein [Marinobacterium sp.]|nr:DUF2173 family protein [Marinobacterium sp.]
MTANLDVVTQVKGFVNCGEWNDAGQPQQVRGNLPESAGDVFARFCRGNSLIQETAVKGLVASSSLAGEPFHGWSISAGDYTLAAQGNVGCMVLTEDADMNEVFAALQAATQ